MVHPPATASGANKSLVKELALPPSVLKPLIRPTVERLQGDELGSPDPALRILKARTVVG
jgi:hypothetical protein